MSLSRFLPKHTSQSDMYASLRTNGSGWLRKHILYADKQMVILNKPPNLVSQLDVRQAGKKDYNSSFSTLNPVFHQIKEWIPSAVPCTVHRLDRQTTGCLIVALNPLAAKGLSRQFEQKTITKTYLALVRGGAKSFKSKAGHIEQPLEYNDGHGSIAEVGKGAVTEWELLGSSSTAPVSLLKLDLLTGSKHQLRIHASKCLSTPILGDNVHSRSQLTTSITNVTRVPLDRLFLHAFEISLFKYHQNGKRYRLGVRAPVPEDFQKICRDLDLPLGAAMVQATLLVNDEITSEDSVDRLWPDFKYNDNDNPE